MTEHLRLSGVYWGLTALHLMGHPEALPRDETIKFVLDCQNADGGFGAAPGHDSHMLYTLSAVQILATVEALSELENSNQGGKDKVAQCMYDEILRRALLIVHSRCRPSGSRHRYASRRQVGRAGYSILVLRFVDFGHPR